MMALATQFDVEVYLPAPVAERRVHGLAHATCALVVGERDGNPASLESALSAILPNEEGTAVVSLRDFGRDPFKAVSDLHRIEPDIIGLDTYWLSAGAGYKSIVAANVEMLALIQITEAKLRDLAKSGDNRTVKPGHFSRQSDISRLIGLADGASLVTYAPSENSIELFGDERTVLNALHRIEAVYS